MKCDTCTLKGKCGHNETLPGDICASYKWKDMVNEPPHYNTYATEVIDVIKCMLTEEQYKGYLLGNMLKYRLRAGFKLDSGLERDNKRAEDLSKSNWYQDKMR